MAEERVVWTPGPALSETADVVVLAALCEIPVSRPQGEKDAPMWQP
ncbi:hypothetical protein ACWGN5_38285 [Streptomyces sp. NPDC055815]